MLDKKEDFPGTIVTIMFIVSCVSLLNGQTFEIFQTYFKYVFMFVIVLIVLLNLPNIPFEQLVCFIVLFVCILFSSLKNGLDSGSFFTVLSGVLSIFCYSLISLSYKQQKICSVFSIGTILYICIKSIGYYNIWYDNKRGLDSINPNTYAMFLLYLTIFLAYSIETSKLKKKKKYIILLVSLSTYGILILKARGCLLGMLFFILCKTPLVKYIIQKAYRREKIVNIFLCLVYFGGAILPVIYCKMVDYLNEAELYIMFAGKDIYTRYIVWDNFIDYVTSKVGVMFTGFSGEQVENILQYVHNNSLIIIGYIGIIGFILFFVFLKKTYCLVVNYSDVNNVIYYLCFLSIFVVGFTEVTTFWATMYGVEFLLLCNRDLENSCYG